MSASKSEQPHFQTERPDLASIRVVERPSRRRRKRPIPMWVIVIPVVQIIMVAAIVFVILAGRDDGATTVATRQSPTVVQPEPSRNDVADSAPKSVPKLPPKTASGGVVLGGSPSPQEEIVGVSRIYERPPQDSERSKIDQLVFEDLKQIGIEPANACSDETFVRRVYVDTLGTLPTADEARSFLNDNGPKKRRRLIDELLERPEFADYWAMKWCDTLRVKAEFPINLWPNAAQAYHRWIRNALRDNLPYDDFAWQLLTSSGSNFRTPQVNFYRALQSKEPEAIAATVALTFMCERTENWDSLRLKGMSQFFSKVGYKPTGEWKEEIVFYDPRSQGSGSPNASVVAIYPNGKKTVIAPGQDPRVVFAQWLIDERNPWFARAEANRIWSWLVGQGIVDPHDDVRKENPASNLLLLNHLAERFIASGYDRRALMREILNSQVYQFSCIPASDDPRAVRHFAYYPTRRLDAEVLIDALCRITETTETYMSIIPEPYTFLPPHQRAISLPDGSITSSFLEMFGRPSRDTGLDSERNNRLNAPQALHLLNSNHVRNKIRQGTGIKRVFERSRDTWDTTDLLYLTILSRRPTEQELRIGGTLCDTESGTRDLAWALINSDEFLFRH